MDAVPQSFDAPKAIIVAGLFGSILSLSFIDGMSLKQRALAVFMGMVMAHYLATYIAFLFNEPNYAETIGFLVGLFGMSITAAIFRAIKNSNLWSFIMSRWGGSNQTPPSNGGN